MQLPYNLDAEKEVLSSILQDNDKFCDVCEIVKDTDFYDTKHQILYKTMAKLFSNNEQITINSVVMELGGKVKEITITFLATIASFTVAISAAVTNAKIVRELSKRRKVILEGSKLLQSCSDTQNSLETALGEFENNITFTEEKSNIWSMNETMEATLETVESNFNNGGKVVGMETGLTTLDRALNGFQKSDVVIIAGRPSMGKTVFAINIAERLSRKHSVYYASLEMPKEKLGMRLLSAKSKINSLKISTGNIENREWDKIAKDTSLLSNNKLYIDDSSSLTMLDIKSRCKKLKMQHDLDVIIVDHIGLVSPHTRRKDRNLELGDISRMGKIIAKELECTVIFLSQLSRAPEARSDHRPRLSDLRESGNIEQDADTVVMLYRDEYYNSESEDKGIMEVLVRKNRDGQLGTLKFAYLEQYQLIGELDVVH
jgi:replicative DNA helicase